MRDSKDSPSAVILAVIGQGPIDDDTLEEIAEMHLMSDNVLGVVFLDSIASPALVSGRTGNAVVGPAVEDMAATRLNDARLEWVKDLLQALLRRASLKYGEFKQAVDWLIENADELCGLNSTEAQRSIGSFAQELWPEFGI